MENNNESLKEQESKPIKINNAERRYSLKVNSSKEISDKLHTHYIYKDNLQFNLFQNLILIFKRMNKTLQIIIIHLK